MFSKVIPDYARDFKNEYLFIWGINNEFKYFVYNINEASRGLFENHRVDKIKKFIKKFVLAQKLGYLNDVSNFEIKSSDVEYLIKIEKYFNNFNQFIKFVKDCYDEADQIFIDPYPGFKNIYDDFELFCSKFKIKYEDVDRFWDYCTDSDSDSDGVDSDDLKVIFPDSDSDSDSV